MFFSTPAPLFFFFLICKEIKFNFFLIDESSTSGGAIGYLKKILRIHHKKDGRQICTHWCMFVVVFCFYNVVIFYRCVLMVFCLFFFVVVMFKVVVFFYNGCYLLFFYLKDYYLLYYYLKTF